jgi:hypothetical protein
MKRTFPSYPVFKNQILNTTLRISEKNLEFTYLLYVFCNEIKTMAGKATAGNAFVVQGQNVFYIINQVFQHRHSSLS